jgi:hypothetical protein
MFCTPEKGYAIPQEGFRRLDLSFHPLWDELSFRAHSSSHSDSAQYLLRRLNQFKQPQLLDGKRRDGGRDIIPEDSGKRLPAHHWLPTGQVRDRSLTAMPGDRLRFS